MSLKITTQFTCLLTPVLAEVDKHSPLWLGGPLVLNPVCPSPHPSLLGNALASSYVFGELSVLKHPQSRRAKQWNAKGPLH